MLRSFARRLLLAALTFAAAGGYGQTTPAATKETIGVGPVKATPALQADMVARGKAVMFERVLQSMDGHITSTLVQMRKFQVVSGSDLTDIFAVGAKGDTGAFDPATVPEAARLKLPKYLVVTTVDSFLEENQTAQFRTGTKTKRRFQLSAQVKITNTTTGEILESSNQQIERVDVLDKLTATDSNARTDDLMPKLARELAEKVAWRTADVLFPAKIVDLEDKVATINRGDTFGLKVGDVLEAYGPARAVTDPDSGEVIKKKGKKVGVIRITEVEPTYSQGEVVEDKGLAVGGVLSKRVEVDPEDE